MSVFVDNGSFQFSGYPVDASYTGIGCPDTQVRLRAGQKMFRLGDNCFYGKACPERDGIEKEMFL